MRFHFSCTRNPHTEREVYTMRTPRLRLLSAILAVALFFTLLPVSALAEGGGSNANTGLTIGITGSTDSLNYWDVSNSISMKEVSPAVYEVTFENKSYEDIFGIGCTGGFKFAKDNSWDNFWGFGAVSSGELHDAVYYGALITINPGSDDEVSKHNFIIRLDLTNWDWDTKTGATFTITVTAPSRDFTFDATTGTIKKYNGNDTVVVIPAKINGTTVETIGHAAFQNSAVTSVTIPDSVTAIHDGAFVNCTSLKSVTLPSSLSSISESLFLGCSQLTTIHIPDFVYSIQPYAFSNCGNLKTIRIPVSVTFIGDFAFDGCPSSMTVTYSGSKTQWDKIIGTYELLNIPLVCNKLEATFTADGESISTQTIDRGGKFTAPAAPSKENYTFAGWYNGDEPFDFDADTTNAPNVLELVAKWEKSKYTVKFVSNHGSFADQTIEYGKPIDTAKLTIPEVEGYTFDGWYADENRTIEFDFTKPITSDTKVYAKWEKNAPNTYALNVSGAFVYVDGVDVTAPAGDTSLHLEKDASVRLVADPDRMPSGMVFDRWTILNGTLNADDAEKFETGRTLEEFAFTMPAEPLSIEATPRMQEEEGSDTASVILGVTLGTAATALVAWQAYDLGMSLYQEHWLPADFVMPKTRAELALLLWNTAGRPAPAAQPAFTDITDPDTAQAAQWAVETGLMTPKSADRFKPEKSVTRWKAIRSWKRVTNQNT